MASMKFSPARQTNRPFYVDPNLLDPATTHVYIRVDCHKPPLHPADKGPYRVVKRFRKYFEVDIRTHVERISVDRLKTAYLSIELLNSSPAACAAPT